MWYWHLKTHICQWNRTEDPDLSSYTFGHLMFANTVKNKYWRKDSVFNKQCWSNRLYKNEDGSSSLFTRFNSPVNQGSQYTTWDPNLAEKDVEDMVPLTGPGKDSEQDPRSPGITPAVDTRNLMVLRSFRGSRQNTVVWVTRPLTAGEESLGSAGVWNILQKEVNTKKIKV